MVKQSNNGIKLMGVILLTPIFLFFTGAVSFAADEYSIIELARLQGITVESDQGSKPLDINNIDR